jgi:hypothetical protein
MNKNFLENYSALWSGVVTTGSGIFMLHVTAGTAALSGWARKSRGSRFFIPSMLFGSINTTVSGLYTSGNTLIKIKNNVNNS